MVITVNGKQEQLEQEMSVEAFLNAKGLSPEVVVVEHNGSIVKKEQMSSIVLNDNDTLEVLRFVGGG